eukprot:755091-Hanusia_phi.AAC.8
MLVDGSYGSGQGANKPLPDGCVVAKGSRRHRREHTIAAEELFVADVGRSHYHRAKAHQVYRLVHGNVQHPCVGTELGLEDLKAVDVHVHEAEQVCHLLTDTHTDLHFLASLRRRHRRRDDQDKASHSAVRRDVPDDGRLLLAKHDLDIAHLPRCHQSEHTHQDLVSSQRRSLGPDDLHDSLPERLRAHGSDCHEVSSSNDHVVLPEGDGGQEEGDLGRIFVIIHEALQFPDVWTNSKLEVAQPVQVGASTAEVPKNQSQDVCRSLLEGIGSGRHYYGRIPHLLHCRSQDHTREDERLSKRSDREGEADSS